MRLATICFCGLLFVLCFIAGWNVAPHRHTAATRIAASADGSQVQVRCAVERVYP